MIVRAVGNLAPVLSDTTALEAVLAGQDVLRFRTEKGEMNGAMTFPIGASCFMTVGHLFRLGFPTTLATHVSSKRSVLLASSQCHHDMTSDVLVYTCQSVVRHDMLEAFAVDIGDIDASGDASVAYVDALGKHHIFQTTYTTGRNLGYTWAEMGSMLRAPMIFEAPFHSEVGSCGSLLIAHDKKRGRNVICGYLCASAIDEACDRSFFRPIDQKSIVEPLRRVEMGFPANEPMIKGVARALLDRYTPCEQSAKSPWRDHHLKMDHVPYIMSATDHNQGKSNRYVLAPWAAELSEYHGFRAEDYGLTDGRSGVVEGVDHRVSPFEHVIMGTVQSDDDLSGLVGVNLDWPRFWLLDRIKPFFPEAPYKQPMTLEEVLNGLPAPVLNRVDIAKSATFPAGKKRDHMYYVDGRWHLSPSLVASFKYAQEDLLSGDFVMMGKMSHKVDEVKPMEKIMAGQTRMVFGIHFVHFLLIKMYLGPILCFLSLFERCVGVSIGISATSPSWDKTCRRLLEWSDTWMEIDYSKMDRKARRVVLIQVFQFFVCVAEAIGYSPKQVAALRTVLNAALRPVLSYKGDFFMWLFGFISGLFGTAQIVSYEAWYVFALCVAKLAKADYGKFDDMMCDLGTAFFGDDTLLAPRPSLVARGFTPVWLTSTVASFGYVISNGTDKTKPVCLAPFESCGFLSRWFKRCDFADGRVAYLGALREDSIYRMLLYIKRLGQGGPDPVIAADCLYNAHREWWLHGREAFDKFTPFYVKNLALLSQERPVHTFEELAWKYWHDEFTTWTGGGQASQGVVVIDGLLHEL